MVTVQPKPKLWEGDYTLSRKQTPPSLILANTWVTPRDDEEFDDY